MRVLLVTPLFFPSLAGAAVYFDTLARAVHRRDPAIRLTILTRRVPGAPWSEWSEGTRVLRVLPRARRGQGRGRLQAVLTGALILAVSYVLRSDVVHYHTLVSYRVLHALAPLFRAHLVGDMRDLAAADEGADARVYAHCARVICASENIVAYLRATGLRPERLVHVPVPLAPLPRPSAADVTTLRRELGVGAAPYVAYVGNLTAAKGVPELLDAMRRLWRSEPALHLVLAGVHARGADPAFDRHLDDVLHGEDRVHCAGPVPRERIAALLAGAAVFVLPSRSEGLPRSCLEALALGVRSVLPPGVPEFTRHCGEAVLEHVDAESIEAAIAAALRREHAPVYPLDAHAPDAVAERTIAVWKAAAPQDHSIDSRRR